MRVGQLSEVEGRAEWLYDGLSAFAWDGVCWADAPADVRDMWLELARQEIAAGATDETRVYTIDLAASSM